MLLMSVNLRCYSILYVGESIVYIGESGRTTVFRIKEHLRMNKQTVYCHLANLSKRPTLDDVSWEILHVNIHVLH